MRRYKKGGGWKNKLYKLRIKGLKKVTLPPLYVQNTGYVLIADKARLTTRYDENYTFPKAVLLPCSLLYLMTDTEWVLPIEIFWVDKKEAKTNDIFSELDRMTKYDVSRIDIASPSCVSKVNIIIPAYDIIRYTMTSPMNVNKSELSIDVGVEQRKLDHSPMTMYFSVYLNVENYYNQLSFNNPDWMIFLKVGNFLTGEMRELRILPTFRTGEMRELNASRTADISESVSARMNTDKDVALFELSIKSRKILLRSSEYIVTKIDRLNYSKSSQVPRLDIVPYSSSSTAYTNRNLKTILWYKQYSSNSFNITGGLPGDNKPITPFHLQSYRKVHPNTVFIYWTLYSNSSISDYYKWDKSTEKYPFSLKVSIYYEKENVEVYNTGMQIYCAPRIFYKDCMKIKNKTLSFPRGISVDESQLNNIILTIHVETKLPPFCNLAMNVGIAASYALYKSDIPNRQINFVS